MEEFKEDVTAKQHAGYFLYLLRTIPYQMAVADTNRMMFLYFCISGLDILGQLHLVTDKQRIIDWIYQFQIENSYRDDTGKEKTRTQKVNCGFIGGGFIGPINVDNTFLQSHISMTYTALCSLIILGDDLTRVNREQILTSLTELQVESGCFQAVVFGSECDTRFIFCAVAICYMLNDFSCIDCDKIVDFIASSQSFDGGIALLPRQEGHGGSTYCALAALKLLDRLDDLPFKETTKRFCVNRMVGGFNGRVNKPPDTCYTFWVGGSMQMLDMQSYIHADSTREFLLKNQKTRTGGFSKLPAAENKKETPPDPLHSYYSVCGMSLINEPGFQPIEASLGLTKRAFDSIKRS